MIISGVLIALLIAVVVVAVLNMVRIAPSKKQPKSVMVPGKGITAFHPEGFIDTDDEELIEFFDKLPGYTIDGQDNTLNAKLDDEGEDESDQDVPMELGEDPATWTVPELDAYCKKHDIAVPGKKVKANYVKAVREHLGQT